ncbi:MAG: DNA glycosylase [Bacilli bacterium]|nr:DNA glycosylase [Bacilli bacterium]
MKLYVKDFDLKQSITSGQFFRYEFKNDYYYIILKDRIVKIKQIDDYIIVDSNNMRNIKETVESFFSLDIDYNKINDILINKDNSIKDIIRASIGYKIQRMDPFETVISYIISANNSVNNIRNCVNKISNKYGKKILFENNYYYLFPTKEELKNITLEELVEMKLGFRAKYVKTIIDKINCNEFDLDIINKMSSKEALSYLMKENGIGLKVASCILLFSYSRYDVYPIDIWVKKIMKERFNIEKEKDIKEYMENKYKDYSGLVIQYLFNYKRNMQ